MVLVTFKTITQLSFTLELEPTLTIAEVKQKIAADKGEDYAVELQKLIYNGKILSDDSTIEQGGIDASKFVVVMLSRKKTAAPTESATPASAPAAPAPVPAAAAATPAKLETTPAPEQLSSNTGSSASSAPAPAAAPAQSQPGEAAITAEQEIMIESIVSMGYPREQVIAILKAALWNPDRAVDLLLTGDPEGEALNFAEEEPQDVSGGLEALAHMPQVEEFRSLVRENPAILPNLMQQIAQLNPELMNAIAQDQEGFLRLLEAPAAAEQPAAGGRQVVEISPQEMEAINRIKDMGFRVSERLIVEAYFACDKNEEATINYILNNMDDE